MDFVAALETHPAGPKHDLTKRFGRLVAAHRRRKGMTQESLASAAEMSIDMISRIESGGTGARFPSIEKLAAALGVDAAELFTPDLPSGALQRRQLTDVTARLAGLSDTDLAWVGSVLGAVLKTRS